MTSDVDAPSIRSLLAETTDRLGDAAQARWVCEVATGLDGDELRSALDQAATDRIVAHLDHMLGRLDAGEPLQYVLGRWGFRRLDLAVDPRVLIPRPETEAVAGVAIDLARHRHREVGAVTIADLGTGSGAIGLSVADELPLDGVTVWLTDASDDALDVARANLAGLGRRAVNVRIAQGSWFDAFADEVDLDVIVSNPPYIADGSVDVEEIVRRWEPDAALFAGADGLDAIRALVTGGRQHLRRGGWLVLEIGFDQGAAVADLFDRAGYVEVEIRPDLGGHDRIAIARAPG